jgi:hypothetical protein
VLFRSDTLGTVFKMFDPGHCLAKNINMDISRPERSVGVGGRPRPTCAPVSPPLQP